MPKVLRHDRCVKSDFDKYNNKFWYIYEHDDCTVRTDWGRVGKTPQSKTKSFGSQSAAAAFYDKKCKEKERAGRNNEIAYRKLDVISEEGEVTTKTVTQSNLASIAAKQITTNSPDTIKLIKYLSKANVHNILSSTTMTYNVDSGLFSTPCGIVTQGNIDEANKLLVDIADFVNGVDKLHGGYDNRMFRETAGSYLMLIPQEVGRKLNLHDLFPDLSAVQKQKAILDSLQASLDTVLAGGTSGDKKPKTVEEQVFATKLLLVKDRTLIDRIKAKYHKTLHRGHSCSHLRVKSVYKVEIEAMKKAFEDKGKKVGNIHEYWHGTRVSNVLSILKGGLIIPPSNAGHVTGRMFGCGAYFSSESTKSLNYSYGYWGGSKDNNCFMFLSDVAMGKYYVPRNSYERLPKPGYDSTWAKAGKSGVMNHEMIVYTIDQCNLTYLVEFTN